MNLTRNPQGHWNNGSATMIRSNDIAKAQKNRPLGRSFLLWGAENQSEKSSQRHEDSGVCANNVTIAGLSLDSVEKRHS